MHKGMTKEYICVDKLQKDCDPYHADWREIKADNRHQAKFVYSQLARTEYKDVLCTLKKNFIKL